MIDLKKALGPLYVVAMAALAILALSSFSRLGLSVWQFDRLADQEQWYRVFLSGFRIDLASVCIFFVIPALITVLINGQHVFARCWFVLLRGWIVIGLWFCVFMEVVSPAFIIEYDLRPNRLFIEYLLYPKEISAMLWGGYKTELVIVCSISVISIVLGWKWSEKLTRGTVAIPLYWRPVVFVAVLLVLAMGARSTLGHRPLNPAMVAFSSDPLINDLTLNSAYSIVFALKQMQSEASAKNYYPKMSDSEVIKTVKASMNLDKSDFVSDQQPTLAQRSAYYQGKPKNIVILLMESHGARYVKGLGGLDLSPNIDKLRELGWAFNRMYASGTRSVRGIEAVTSGFSPTPARSVVKLGKSQSNFFTIADLLRSRDYKTQFIYGGESHFDNMKSFFLGNGFEDMQDFATFKNPEFVGSWGASDEDLFNKAHRQFSEMSSQSKPFFSLVFSSSNHTPFEYPDGKIEPYNQPKQSVENAVKYADYALGTFIEKARASAYWNNTVFAVIADHDARTYGSSALPIGHFKIPAVIFGGGIPARKDERLVSQIDLAPTLLSLAGVSSVNPMIGHDLTQFLPVEKQRAMMQRDKNFGWMNADNKVVVLQPGQKVATFQYHPKDDRLVEAKVSSKIIKKAHGNAMWGSLAFEKGYYHSLKDYAFTPTESKKLAHAHSSQENQSRTKGIEKVTR